MCCTASQAIPLLMVMVVVVSCAAPSVATSADTQQEIMLAITVNQLALLKELNTSSSVCDSREGELRELRLMKDAAVEQLEWMKEATMALLEGMKEDTKSELEGMKKETRDELQTMREMMDRLQVMERKGKEVLEAVRSISIVQPQPDLTDQRALHSDDSPSLCAPHKVLYGSRGSLSPSHPQPNYLHNMTCMWQVILPMGTRPVFTWEYFDIEHCRNCHCDWVKVFSREVDELPRMCGNNTTITEPQYNITETEFFILFSSDHSRTGKGFLLNYEAERVS